MYPRGESFWLWLDCHVHFARLPRLADPLDSFPTTCIDLTQGIKFGRVPQAAREFFMRFQDRTFFGTDLGVRAMLSTLELGIEPEESTVRIQIVRWVPAIIRTV